MMMTTTEALEIKAYVTGVDQVLKDFNSMAKASEKLESHLRLVTSSGKEVKSPISSAYNADITKATASLKALETEMFKTGLATRSLVQHMTGVNTPLVKASASAKQATLSFNSLNTALAGFGIYFGAREIMETADAYTNLQNRLKLVSTSQSNLNALSAEMFNIAQATRTPLEQTATLYGKLGQFQKELGVSQRELADMTTTVNQALLISGGTAKEAGNGLIQFAQALGSGRLQGDELRSIMENFPRLSKAIAEGMGVSLGQLKKLGEEGKLTSQIVLESIQKSSGQINKEFQTLTPTIEGGFTQMTNAATKWLGEMNKGSGAGLLLSKAMGVVANNFDILANGAIVLTGAIVAYQLAVNGATIAQAALNVAMGLSPWGIALAGVTAVVGGLVLFSDKIKVGQSGLYTLSDVMHLVTEMMKGDVKGLASFIVKELGDAVNQAGKGLENLRDAIFGGGSSKPIGEISTGLQVQLNMQKPLAQNSGVHYNDLGGQAKSYVQMAMQQAGLNSRGLVITSATRNHNENREAGGSATSYHLKGDAIDLNINNATRATKELLEFINNLSNTFKEVILPSSIERAYRSTYGKRSNVFADGNHEDHLHAGGIKSGRSPVQDTRRTPQQILEDRRKARNAQNEVGALGTTSTTPTAIPQADSDAEKARKKAIKEAEELAKRRAESLAQDKRQYSQSIMLLGQETSQREKSNELLQLQNKYKDMGAPLNNAETEHFKKQIELRENLERADEARNAILQKFVEPAKNANAQLHQLNLLQKAGTISAEQFTLAQKEIQDTLTNLDPVKQARKEHQDLMYEITASQGEVDAILKYGSNAGIYNEVMKRNKDRIESGKNSFTEDEIKKQVQNKIATQETISIQEKLIALIKKYPDALNEIVTSQQAVHRAYMDSNISLSQYTREMGELKKAQLALDDSPLGRMKSGLYEYAYSVSDATKGLEQSIVNSFKGMEDAFVQFVTTGKFSFSDMAQSIISDLTRIAVQQTITGPLAKALLGRMENSGSGGGLSGLGGLLGGLFTRGASTASSGGGTAFAGAASSIFSGSFASGGSFKVPGAGSTDSVLNMMKVTPGERVTVTPPATTQQNNGGSNHPQVVVNVIGAPSEPKVKQRRNSQGQNEISIMFEAVKGEVTRQLGDVTSPMGRTLQNTYSLNPSGGLRT
jgi:lambda family phage tail tape measure protein